MRKLLLFIITGIVLVSCKKESFITSPDAQVNLSTEELKFDTVFTTIGSTTRNIRVINKIIKKLTFLPPVPELQAYAPYLSLHMLGHHWLGQ